MYPTDLVADNHKFREIWATLHSSVLPKVDPSNAMPATGVFLHRGKMYKLVVDGVEKETTV